MHRDVAGIIINQVRAEHSGVTGEARRIVGDVVRVPALLFDSCSEETSGSGQEGEALCEASSSLPV